MQSRQQRIRRDGWVFIVAAALAYAAYVVAQLWPIGEMTYQNTNIPPSLILITVISPFLMASAPPLLIAGIAFLRWSSLLAPDTEQEPEPENSEENRIASAPLPFDPPTRDQDWAPIPSVQDASMPVPSPTTQWESTS